MAAPTPPLPAPTTTTSSSSAPGSLPPGSWVPRSVARDVRLSWAPGIPPELLPGLGLGVLIVVVGAVEIATRSLGALTLLVVIGAAVATAVSRVGPGYALAVMWATGAIQVLADREILLVELVAAMVTAYATSRYGSRALVWAGGLSIPLAASLGLLWVSLRGVGFAFALPSFLYSLATAGGQVAVVSVGWLLLAGLLGVPWIGGLAVRARTQANRSHEQQLMAEEARAYAEVERAAAQEVAAMRQEQTRLARDVHDVVGHSLAVILVQAESAAFLPDDDLDRLRATMTNIATSARRSLQDVRAVLSSTVDPASAGVRSPTVDELVADLRDSGNDVRLEVVGEPWALTPADQTLVFRLAQEMLTNALRHGARGESVFVTERWRGELMLEVHNSVGPMTVGAKRAGGLGLAGMRRRVEEVGGRLTVNRRDSGVDRLAEFTVTAWIPSSATVGQSNDVEGQLTSARVTPPAAELPT